MKIPLLSWIPLISLLQIILGIDIIFIFGQYPNDQRSQLLQLKNSLKFKSGFSINKLAKWNESTDCCNWPGVKCDNSSHVVIGLSLDNETIVSIDNSSSLFSLEYIEDLNLGFNFFNSSPIPVEMYNLKNLKYLNLSNAGFGGQIPSGISRLTRLVILDLSTQFPVGQPLKFENPSLKIFFENATELREVYLDGVNISAKGSEWCEALSSSLPNLRVLSLRNCQVSGPIHRSLLKLRALSVIYLDDNNLSSEVPDFLANFTNLTTLSLIGCMLQGDFPKAILQVQTLQHLDLSYNHDLGGSFLVFQQNGSFKTISLSFTSFSGSLPNSIGNLGNLARIELSKCNFTGSLPSTMANLTSLTYVDFSYNYFTGPFPPFQMSKNLTYIDLSHNALKGSLSFSHFKDLSKLKYVNLGSNLLSGSIPPNLFSLPSLQSLYLNENHFDGQVNEFPDASVSKLDTLDLSSNLLNGSIPKSFFNLSKLSVLSLSSNFFSGKMQFNVIENLRDLSTLDLSYNNLTIDTRISNEAMFSYPQVRVLNLASCRLIKFPDLRNQSKMRILDLSDNQIEGGIPNWIWKVGNGGLALLNLSCNLLEYLEEPYRINRSLSVIDLHSNILQGDLPIPPAFAISVDYSDNNFSSVISPEVGNSLVPVVFFSLSKNRLTGPIPDSICNSSFLQVLDLSQNFLNGKIPSCLMNSSSIVVLDLRRNNLSGTIPDDFPDSCALKTLDLSQNILGRMPRSIVNCKFLEVLNVGNNKIVDQFPCPLRSLSTLRVLVLHSNHFFGELQCLAVNMSWPSLQIIDISFNNFTGKIDSIYFLNWTGMTVNEDNLPPDDSQIGLVSKFNDFHYQDTVIVTMKGLEVELVKILRIFTSIDFSSNKFDGDIPDSVGALDSLHLLNLSNNALTGKIPKAFGNLTLLESLDLSANHLRGQIPEQLTKLTFLSVLNLSVNEFSGRIPTGYQFETFAEDSFQDNLGLCGFPLNRTCTTPTPVPTHNFADSSSDSDYDWLFIFIGMGYGFGVAVGIAPLWFSKQLSTWCDKHMKELIKQIFPTFGFTYIRYNGAKVVAEETIQEFTEDSDEIEDEEEDAEFHGRYCVFCSKFDILRNNAIHDPKCTHHYCLPVTFSSTTPSSSSLSGINTQDF